MTAAAVADLGRDFWTWRRAQMPRTADDIPRLDRPPEWVPDWSPTAVSGYRERLAALDARWRGLEVDDQPVGVQVDHRLIGSALARVAWELDRVRNWERDPGFYVDQTLGIVFDLLLEPPPFAPSRQAQLVRRMRSIPRTLEHARANLGRDLAAPFATVAARNLAEVGSQVRESVAALAAELAPQVHAALTDAAVEAVAALEAYRDWVASRIGGAVADTAVGREHFAFFLREVALCPYTPEELLAMARQEWDRAVVFEAIERNRNRDLPAPPLPADAAAQIARERADEEAVRTFYDREGILTQPASLGHYRNLPLPAYLAPLSWLGVTDDLTAPDRLDADGVSYVPEPRPDLPYFYLANARDPRAGIVHEGAHYQQLAIAYGHDNPLRRHYYDSGPNEGIAFYNEELLLQAGLFDDQPRTREVIYNFMRLRALRVEVDVKVAIGEFDLDTAGRCLEEAVPMDRATAEEEAAMFAATPGQGLTYQIGKLQILRFATDALRVQGASFHLRAFHDYLWRNGNLPIALLRWEYLGLRDDLDRIDAV